MGVVIAGLSLFGAGVLAGLMTVLYFGTYWAQLLDKQVWDMDDEDVGDEDSGDDE